MHCLLFVWGSGRRRLPLPPLWLLAPAPPPPPPAARPGRLPQKIGKRPSDISVVSVMPCVRKQGEADRMMFHTPDGGSRCARRWFGGCAACSSAHPPRAGPAGLPQHSSALSTHWNVVVGLALQHYPLLPHPACQLRFYPAGRWTT